MGRKRKPETKKKARPDDHKIDEDLRLASYIVNVLNANLLSSLPDEEINKGTPAFSLQYTVNSISIMFCGLVMWDYEKDGSMIGNSDFTEVMIERLKKILSVLGDVDAEDLFEIF